MTAAAVTCPALLRVGFACFQGFRVGRSSHNRVEVDRFSHQPLVPAAPNDARSEDDKEDEDDQTDDSKNHARENLVLEEACWG